MEARSSSGSSPGFNLSFNPRKNLSETFDKVDKEVSKPAPLPHIGLKHHQLDCLPVATKVFMSKTTTSATSTARPPLHHSNSSRTVGEMSSSSSSTKNVAVYLRIRPPSSKKKGDNSTTNNTPVESTIEVLDPIPSGPGHFPTRIRTYPPNLSNAYRVNINRSSRDISIYAKEFDFDHVMGPTTSQQNVYSVVAAPMIQDLLASSFTTTSFIETNDDLSRVGVVV